MLRPWHLPIASLKSLRKINRWSRGPAVLGLEPLPSARAGAAACSSSYLVCPPRPKASQPGHVPADALWFFPRVGRPPPKRHPVRSSLLRGGFECVRLMHPALKRVRPNTSTRSRVSSVPARLTHASPLWIARMILSRDHPLRNNLLGVIHSSSTRSDTWMSPPRSHLALAQTPEVELRHGPRTPAHS